jgi:trimeric autotransporter adhesin
VRQPWHRLTAVGVALVAVVAAPLAFAHTASASEIIENFTNPDDNAYDSGATASFSLDGITYTITKTGALADNTVTEDPNLQSLADEDASDNALLFDEDGTGGISAITLTMSNGHSFDIQSLDIDAIANGSITFLASGQSTGVGVVSDGGFATQTVELASANSAFADATSVTIEGGNLEPTLGHIVYSEITPPVVTTTGGATTFTSVDSSTATPVVVDSGVTVSDSESSTLASGTVSITGNFVSGQDVLAFTNTSSTLFGNIVASFNSSTGVLTVTSSGGSATVAQWQDALDAVTYVDTAAEPNTSARTISFSVNDGQASSAAATKTVDVDSPPIVTTTGGTTSYPAGTTAATVDGGVTVTDPSQSTQASGTVSITGGLQTSDTLAFTNTSSTLFGNIVASYNSTTGVLTLTSSGRTATDAQWTNALEAVTFSSAHTTTGDRTVSFVVNDGTDNSAAATKTVDVEFSGPNVITTGGSTAFTQTDDTSSTPVAVDSGVTVTDLGTSELASGTVSITGDFHSGQDVLAFTNTSSTTYGNIAASYNSSTGVLILTSSGGTATVAQWQAALDSVTYADTASVPNTAIRTISFTVTDDNSLTSIPSTKTVTVADVDQTPVVSTTGGTTDYPAGTAPVTVDGNVQVAYGDNSVEASGTVSITGGFHSGDTLAFTNTSSTLFGNIQASYNSTTGALTLTSSGGTATDAQWSNAFSAVTFSAGPAATPGDRTVSFVVNDGVGSSAAAPVDTVEVLVPPTVTTDSGSAAFVAGDNVTSTPVDIDGGLTVTDGVSSTLVSGAVSITGNFQSNEDMLSFSNTSAANYGNIAGSYDTATGVLTLTSPGDSATLAQWQAALGSVTYTDTAITPNTATRAISFTVTDGASLTSNTATRTVTVADTDQTPVVTTSGGTRNYLAGAAPVTIDGSVGVTDLDNATQASGTVSITGGFHSGDALALTNTSSTLFGNIDDSYDATTGVLTLTSEAATATAAQWANALSAVTFSTPSGAALGDRTVSFVTNDGTEDSAAAADTVDVLTGPVVTTTGGSTAFSSGDNATSTPVPVDPGLIVSDDESGTLASATVAITGNFQPNQDVLGFTNIDATTFGNTAASYDTATGVLTLTSPGGSATLAQWQAALSSVTYTDTAITPNTAARTISFTVNDGTATSVAGTKAVTVNDTDQTPVVTTSAGVTAFVAPYAAAGTPVPVDPGVTISDRGDPTLAAATVAVTANFGPGQDALAFTNTSASTYGNIGASYDSATGVLSLTSTGATATLAQWQAALRSVTYADTSASPSSATRTISFGVNDGAENSLPATKSVTLSQSPAPAATPTTATTIATTVTVSSSTNPANLGRQVTLLVTVSPVPGGGTVTLTAGGATLPGCALLSPSQTTGRVDCSYKPSTPGTEIIDATYSGYGAFEASTGSLSETVERSSKTTTPPPASSACAGTGQSTNADFVCRLYEDLLHRAPDTAGETAWLQVLQGGASRTEIAEDILVSAEYRQDLVAGDYDHVFGHPAPSASLGPWLTHLDNGASDQSVLAGMLGSDAYYATSGGTPAGFIRALYKLLLGRSVDASGLAFWESQLSSGATRSSVALGILSSVEYSRDFVATQYERLLGRAPQPGELSLWVVDLAQGGSEESVIAGIAGSTAFYNDVSQ